MPGVLYDPVMRRLWVFGRRVHHGAVGAALVAVGAVLALHDRADWREWL